MKGHYAVIRHRDSGKMFRIARRITQMPGREPTHDWVKIACTDQGWPDWTAPQFLIANISPRRSNVEVALLRNTSTYEIVRWVRL